MQDMVASASSVLLDVGRRKQQLPRETSALRKAMEVGQTRPLESLMHRMRCCLPASTPYTNFVYSGLACFACAAMRRLDFSFSHCKLLCSPVELCQR